MFDGKADWSKIRELKEALGIPVIGSGDLFSAGDAAGMLAATGCDGIMIARGGLGNPWIFRQTLDILAGRELRLPSPAECHAVALQHLELFCQCFGERVALLEMRKHLCWYARGVPGAAQFRAHVNRLHALDELRDALHHFFHQVSVP